jgi:hypothetical protein
VEESSLFQLYTPEDNGSNNCQVEDESGNIVGLPGILFRLCHNNIRLHVIGTGRVVPALPPSQDYFDLSWRLCPGAHRPQWTLPRRIYLGAKRS